jgi:hypothetical protein
MGASRSEDGNEESLIIKDPLWWKRFFRRQFALYSVFDSLTYTDMRRNNHIALLAKKEYDAV